MNQGFWEQSPKKIARDLVGKTLIVGSIEATVLQTEGYYRFQNDSGIYKPIIEMPPGCVFCPRSRNSVLLLIATYDSGQPGGCVLIRAVEINGLVYNGPGRVTERIGIIDARSVGMTKWLDYDTLSVGIGTAPQARHLSGKPALLVRRGNGIGRKTLQHYLPRIAEKFMNDDPKVSFRDFVNGLLETCQNERDLMKALK